MAILNREDFTERIRQRIGDSTETADLEFVADIMDTYNSFADAGETVPKEEHDKLQADYDKLAKDYRDRFFSGKGGDEYRREDDDELSVEDIRIKDLFKERN